MPDVAIFIDESQVKEVKDKGDVGSGQERFHKMIKNNCEKVFVVTNYGNGKIVVAEISDFEKIYPDNSYPPKRWKYRVKGTAKKIKQKPFNEMFKEEVDCRFPCYVTKKDGATNENPSS